MSLQDSGQSEPTDPRVIVRHNATLSHVCAHDRMRRWSDRYHKCGKGNPLGCLSDSCAFG